MIMKNKIISFIMVIYALTTILGISGSMLLVFIRTNFMFSFCSFNLLTAIALNMVLLFLSKKEKKEDDKKDDE